MNDFTLFNLPHIIVLILTVVFSFAFAYTARKFPSTEKPISWTLIIIIILTTSAFITDKYVNGYLSIKGDLPMQLCDWVIILVIITFITRSQYSYETAYFWAMGGTLQALITPDITVNFPSPGFIIFFANHASIIISIIYFTFAFRLRPYPVSIRRTFIWTQVYFISALLINIILGANYGFIMYKPEQGSILNFMGPWPYYLISLEILALISFFIYYLPFYINDKLSKSTK